MSISWSELAQTHAGETAVVIGNGPSLRDTPRSLLEGYPSFGANRIYLLEGFAPTYYVSVNPLVIEQFAEEALERFKNTTKAFFLSARSITPSLSNASDRILLLRSVGGPIVFSLDPSRGIHEGWTVTYVSLQLAYFMGFKRVLLVGVDHSFSGRPDREVRPNEELEGYEEADPNHFHPDYFKGSDTRWHMADLEKSEQAYAIAREVFEADGREIINLTPGTRLEVFPLGDICDYDSGCG